MMKFHRATFVIAILSSLALSSSPSAHARELRVRAAAPATANGMVGLPYNAMDAQGNQWFVYSGGWLQQRGNAPIYSQGASLQINGNGVQAQVNQAKVDEKTGELIFENLQIGGTIAVTRRVFVNVAEGYVRYVDVLHNVQPAEQRVNVMLQTNSNYGLAASQNITEPGGKQRPIGWAAQTPAGRAIVELFAGRGTKNPPSISFQPGNSFVQTSWQLTIPAGKDVALMHVHTTAASPEAGATAMTSLRESDLYRTIPPDVRKLIVNFTPGTSYIGDRELLRGDLLDVVELRGGGAGGAVGDQLKGTIKDATFKLTTFYGTIDLAADKVISLFNVGQFRPRQLIVTSDGEIFGGKLSKESIELQLSSGQVTQVPLSQIARIGWRKRASEREDHDVFEASNDRPFILLRSGDKMSIDPPAKSIDVNTRYGLLKIEPAALASIAFASEDSGVHRVSLTDGSRFSGLVVGDQFTFKLAGGAGGQEVSFPSSSLALLHLLTAGEGSEDPAAATLKLANDDVLVGTLVGQLKLDTAFDTITLNAPEIRALSRAGDSGSNAAAAPSDSAGGFDVQIELWDQTRMSGQLQEPHVSCSLASGVQVRVPVPLVGQYTQPLPLPSASMTDRINALVVQLGTEEWKERERAEQSLLDIGSPVVRVLKAARAAANPEAQQRIDAIISQIEKREAKTTPPVTPPANGE